MRFTMTFDDPVRTVPVQREFGVGSLGVSSNCFTVNCAINSNFFSWGTKLADSVKTYDHGDEMFETGHTMDNAFSISGGNERTTFYLSLSELNQDGFIVSNQ